MWHSTLHLQLGIVSRKSFHLEYLPFSFKRPVEYSCGAYTKIKEKHRHKRTEKFVGTSNNFLKTHVDCFFSFFDVFGFLSRSYPAGYQKYNIFCVSPQTVCNRFFLSHMVPGQKQSPIFASALQRQNVCNVSFYFHFPLIF